MDLNQMRDQLIERDIQDRAFRNLLALDVVRSLRREHFAPIDLGAQA